MSRIAYLTDVHLDEAYPLELGVQPGSHLEAALADVKRRGIEEIVFGGDIGAPTALPYFFEQLRPFRWQLLLGNHDSFAEVSPFYSPHADRSELYYRKDYAGCTGLFLDTSKEVVSAAQMKWLREELGAAQKVLLFMHHPVLPVESAVDRLYPLHNRLEVQQLLHESGVEVSIFCGHYHTGDERSEGNIRQIVTPALSFQILKGTTDVEPDTSSFGYTIINAGAGTVDAETVTLTREHGLL